MALGSQQEPAMRAVTFPTAALAAWFDRGALSDLLRFPPLHPPGLATLLHGKIAERLLALLTSSAVRKGSLEKMQFSRCFPDLLGAIRRCVHADKPVQLTLMAFPFKAPNMAKVGPRRMPDLAELIALVRLDHLNAKAKCIYPPGLEIHVIHDGSYIGPVFGVAAEEVRLYESYFAHLVRAVGMDRFIRLHDLQALAGVRLGDAEQQEAQLRGSIQDWKRSSANSEEWKDRFSKTLGMIDLRGLAINEVCTLLDHGASGELPSGYVQLEQQVRIAMLRYHARDSLLHACDPRPDCFPDAIHMTTQCRPRRLAIWMVRRGRSLLPWHGVGAVDRDAGWRVALARDILWDPSYRPIFVQGEDTPFFYQQD